MAIWKIMTVDGPRLASGRVDDGPKTMLPAELSIDDLLAGRSEFTFAQASVAADGDPVPADARLLAPLGTQEVWAAGVTYLRSRAARMEESTAPDHYDRVYMSDRPELFFKAAAWRVRASGESVGIRDDSTWNVPEPELAVVANAQGEVVAYTIGNDMSSRSIEGDNPLYLPQAKVYRHSTALGPCLVGVEEAPPEDRLVVRLTINRAGEELFDESIVARYRPGPIRGNEDWLAGSQVRTDIGPFVGVLDVSGWEVLVDCSLDCQVPPVE